MKATHALGFGGQLIALASAVLSGAPMTRVAEQVDSRNLPLLTESSLRYVGGIRLPAQTLNEDSFSFGGHPIAFNPVRGTLFVTSYRSNVAEVTIPEPVNSADVNELPSATFVQPFTDPTEGHMSELSMAGISGLMVYGGRLYGTAAIYYDANNTQRFSHFSRSVQLDQPSFSGWSQVWEAGKTGFVSGMMALMPADWQASLGGPAITGQCCIPIVSRTSNGPAAFAFDPARVGQFTVDAAPLLYYTLEHATLGPWDGSNPIYGAATGMAGLAVIAGTRTALFFGRNGLGPHCYGSGTSDRSLNNTRTADGETLCYDPTTTSKGSHAYPYRYQVWAYDLNDFAAVRNGSKQPWEVEPYGVWPLTLPIPEPTVRLGGLGYDAQRQMIYVSQLAADQDVYSFRPVIHAIRIAVPLR